MEGPPSESTDEQVARVGAVAEVLLDDDRCIDDRPHLVRRDPAFEHALDGVARVAEGAATHVREGTPHAADPPGVARAFLSEDLDVAATTRPGSTCPGG